MAGETNKEGVAEEKAEQEAANASAPKKSNLAYIALVIAVIVIVILVIVVFRLLNKPKPAEDTDIRATVITEENVDEVRAKAEEESIADYYNCQMNVEWHFKDASSPSYDAYVANPTDNACTVYFDVNLDDGGELVYSSPYIPVGAELKDIELAQELDEGTYPAVVTYHLVDEDKNELSNVSVAVTLYIEN